METGLSRYCQCGKLLPPQHRKYCADCSPQASLLWKREVRRQSRRSRYWLDYWLKVTGNEVDARHAYNAYMRTYMRQHRLKREARVARLHKEGI